MQKSKSSLKDCFENELELLYFALDTVTLPNKAMSLRPNQIQVSYRQV